MATTEKEPIVVNGLTYSQFLAEVDTVINELTLGSGMTHRDFADRCTWDMFENGCIPAEVAEVAEDILQNDSIGKGFLELLANQNAPKKERNGTKKARKAKGEGKSSPSKVEVNYDGLQALLLGHDQPLLPYQKKQANLNQGWNNTLQTVDRSVRTDGHTIIFDLAVLPEATRKALDSLERQSDRKVEGKGTDQVKQESYQSVNPVFPTRLTCATIKTKRVSRTGKVTIKTRQGTPLVILTDDQYDRYVALNRHKFEWLRKVTGATQFYAGNNPLDVVRFCNDEWVTLACIKPFRL